MISAKEIAAGLGGQQSGEGWMASCPAHNDNTPSLSISAGKNGTPLVYCHSGCTQGEVIKKLKAQGLWNMADNAISQESTTITPVGGIQKGEGMNMQIIVSEELEEAVAHLTAQWIQDGYQLAKIYDYSDNFKRIRLDHPEPLNGKPRKIIRPISLNGSGKWELKEPNHPPAGAPLYGRKGVVDNPNAMVVVVEGEKCVDALDSLGYVAVTSGSNTSAKKADWRLLKGRIVAMWPDNDSGGEKYAKAVCDRLSALGCTVYMVGHKSLDLPEGGDVVDWFQANPNAKMEKLPLLPVSGPLRTSEAIMQCIEDIKSEQIDWAWHKRIARGKITVIAGDPNLGKSLITVDLASRVSNGDKMPDGTAGIQCDVIIISAEDGTADTIRPRLEAAGADLSRIHIIDGIKETDKSTGEVIERSFLLSDISELEEVIKSNPEIGIIFIDPISAFVGNIDSHKNSDVRSLLAPLASLAERYKVAVVAVSHLNKSDTKAVYKVSGSLAFVAAARAAFMVMKDKNDATRRLFIPLKNNLAPDTEGMAYRIEGVDDVAKIVWEPDPIAIDVDEALNPVSNKKPSALTAEAADWLKELLKDGPVPAKKALALGADNGFSKATLYRARKSIGAVTSHEGFGEGSKHSWKLDDIDCKNPTP